MEGFEPRDPEEWDASDWSGGCQRKIRLNCGNGDWFRKIAGVKVPDTRRSCGYISPEYAVRGRFSTKSDVFSYDVLVLETASDCAALDTLYPNQPIQDGKTIVSTGNTFELGFFSLGKSKNRYLGIWYKRISICTVVWVANRETPITDKSGLFKVSSHGNLEILSGGNTMVWSSNSTVSGRSYNPVVQLLDNANLVVWDTDKNNTNKNLIWQSFDHPCDTLLPGMKLGKDLVTGLERTRIMHWIERIQEWIVYGDFIVDNCDMFAVCGPYGSCSINKHPPCTCMEGFEPRNPEEWVASDWSSGCERKTPLDCGDVNGDGFRKITGVKVPDTRKSWYNVSMTLGECEMACRMKCSCMAYANLDISNGGSGCLLCGYISPEYAVHGRFSIKSDVFSFGVLVLEIVSGKKNREFSHEEHSDNLLGHEKEENAGKRRSVGEGLERVAHVWVDRPAAEVVRIWMPRRILVSFLYCAALDTIYADQSIKDGNTIVSNGKMFELGFFSPGKSKNRYLGIWYKKISICTVVWVANRETPITDKSGLFKVSSDGNLVILSGGNTTVWSSNSMLSGRSNKPVVVVQLLDTGNLAVWERVKNSTNKKLIWQSFDYIGDTFLPGMKFGKDLVTGIEWLLTSWKSPDDPSIGEYSNRLDTNGYPQCLGWQNQDIISRLGPWNGLGFSGFPNDDENSVYSYDFVINDKEIYHTFKLKGSVVQRLILTWDGRTKIMHWIDRIQDWIVYGDLKVDNCDLYAVCGRYGSCSIDKHPPCTCMEGFEPRNPKEWDASDWSSGCKRITPLNGGNVNGDWFRKITGVKVPDTRRSCGYISPEYAVHGRFSIKSDVFSFGVLVLEIVSGKKNREFTNEDHSDNLLGHVS
ncbi:hypothetical protein L1987_62200 [Smallanthus sonchifolius]|uniref:Uncharacterized protein n=1 Tax=Smallanthus sonchifolius TaxID=185202 RepID=A0ACB9C9S1_9ASTR|nr:hypothetical protein L1987_62200 [Smallanthus sonchifolius]